MEEPFYFFLSFLVAVLAVAAVFIGRKALQRGLTYYEMHATLYALGLMAVARVWHSVRELVVFEGEWAEIVEYLLYIGAYAFFIFLAMRVFRTKIHKKD